MRRYAEPLDLIPLALRKISNQILFAILQFDKPIDVDRLTESVKAIYNSFPLTRSVLRVSGKWPYWQQVEAPVINIIEHPTPFSALSNVTSESLDCAVCYWLVHNSSGDSLCIAVDHTLADAAGVQALCYLLAATYSNNIDTAIEKLGIRPDQDRAHLFATSGFGLGQKARSLWRSKLPGRDWQLTEIRQVNRTQTAYRVKTIGDNCIAKLKQYGRPRNATINDLLMASFYCALREELTGSERTSRSIQFTVDLRRYLKDKTRLKIANLSGTATVCLNSELDIGFDEALRKISTQTMRIKRSNPGLDTALFAGMLFLLGYQSGAAIFAQVLKPRNSDRRILPVLTNLGNLQKQKLGFGTLKPSQASLIGPSLASPGIMLAASGFQNSLTLSVGYCRSAVSDELIASIVAKTAQHLQKAAHGDSL